MAEEAVEPEHAAALEGAVPEVEPPAAPPAALADEPAQDTPAVSEVMPLQDMPAASEGEPTRDTPAASGSALPHDSPAALELGPAGDWLAGPDETVAATEAEAERAEDTVPDPPPTAHDDLPRAFQLRNVYEGPAPRRGGLTIIYQVMGGIGLLGLGAAAGFLAAGSRVAPRLQVAPAVSGPSGKPAELLALTPQLQTEIDAAFTATKESRYDDAQKQFTALHDAHPEWPSMAIESARASLYQFDAPATSRILSMATRNGPLPDAAFLTALLCLTHKEFDQANMAFAKAVALDPARPDFYYFWGECLRSQGKPREAGEKYAEALLRNQYETTEDLYRLKLWLSRIQADQEEATGTNAAIDEALKIKPRPSYSAVFAAAARELKAGRFKETGDLLAQAQQLTEPVVFRVIMQDPTFVQESWRPELAGFYK